MRADIQAKLDAGTPILLGPGAGTLDGTVNLPNSSYIRGFATAKTQITMQAGVNAPMFSSSPTGSMTQSYFGGMKLIHSAAASVEGTGSAILRIFGLSNNSVLEHLDLRNGLHQIHLFPSGQDESCAFYGTISNIFAFNARGSVIRIQGTGNVKNSNGAAITSGYCLIAMRNLDIGRCIDPSIWISDMKADGCSVVISGGNFDIGQVPGGGTQPTSVVLVEGNSSPAGAGLPAIAMDGCRVTGIGPSGTGKAFFRSTSRTSPSMIGCQVWANPLSFIKLEWAINTPDYVVLGTVNNGMINFMPGLVTG